MTTLNRKTAEKLALDLMAIPGKSGRESDVATYIRGVLYSHKSLAGNAVQVDRAHKRSPFGGEQGNLIVKIPGSRGRTKEPRRLMMAHMDTVPICVGGVPVRKGHVVHSRAGDTGLGADDRAAPGLRLHEPGDGELQQRLADRRARNPDALRQGYFI